MSAPIKHSSNGNLRIDDYQKIKVSLAGKLAEQVDDLGIARHWILS